MSAYIYHWENTDSSVQAIYFPDQPPLPTIPCTSKQALFDLPLWPVIIYVDANKKYQRFGRQSLVFKDAFASKRISSMNCRIFRNRYFLVAVASASQLSANSDLIPHPRPRFTSSCDIFERMAGRHAALLAWNCVPIYYGGIQLHNEQIFDSPDSDSG